MTRILVIFTDQGAPPWGRILKRGFRHCFTVVQDDRGCWIKVDARTGMPEISAIARADFDVAAFYRAEGCTVVEAAQAARPPRSPFAIANCVGMAKAVLALRSAAFTPWQLYRALTRSAMAARS